MRFVFIPVAGLLAFLLNSCAGSAGSFASMGSISSISASSSAAVASVNPEYQHDVSTATALALNTQDSDGTEVLRSVGKVAAQHGISDWENQAVTFYAIGKGIRDSGVDPASAQSLANTLAGADQNAKNLVLEGFRS